MNIKKITILLCLLTSLTLSLGFTACQSIPLTTKTKMEQALVAQQKQHEIDLRNAIQTISDQKDVVIKAQEAQLQGGSNSLYGANYGFSFYTTPTRLDTIINERVTEAQAAIGVPPTYDAIVKENARMAAELDATKTTLAQLQAAHQSALASNAQLTDEKNKEATALAQAQKDQVAKEQAYNDQITKKQSTLNDLNNQIISQEKAKSDSAAATERLKRELMLACGLAAALCLVGVIYSPIGKEGLGILAAAFGGAAAAIPFIQPWMVATAVIGVIAILTIYFLYKHNLVHKTNTNLVSAIQDEIEKGNGAIKSTISSWNTKYAKNADGTTTEIPDNSVEDYIKEVLKNLGRLPTPVNPVASTTSSVVTPTSVGLVAESVPSSTIIPTITVTPTPTPAPIAIVTPPGVTEPPVGHSIH